LLLPLPVYLAGEDFEAKRAREGCGGGLYRTAVPGHRRQQGNRLRGMTLHGDEGDCNYGSAVTEGGDEGRFPSGMAGLAKGICRQPGIQGAETRVG